ncbi:MAG: hypothetical protein BWY31_01403 [Lentisphaerae bacterium ADurb.Bin242]|nr:MAG: hypothetical protein BWY31_01403 [Lentisphaerae bacterium ADurb.Bin242]
MKKLLSIILFLCLLPSLFAANLLKNGDLSRVAGDGRPEFWWGKVGPECGLEQGVAPDGKNAFRLKNSGTMLTQSVKVESGKVYRARYKLKSEFAKWLTAASFQILWVGKDGKPLFTDYKGQKVWDMKIKNLQGSRDWQNVEMTCEAPAAAAGAEIRLGIVFDTKNAACWFADMEMSEVEKGDPFRNRIAALPYVPGRISMETVFSPDMWEKSTVLGDFLVPNANTRAVDPTSARVFYNDEAVYVNFQCFMKDADKLKADDRITDFGAQESCEVFLLPPGRDEQYQIFISADGKAQVFTEKWNDGNWPMKLHPVRKSGVETRVRYETNFWQVAVKIPFETLGQKVPAESEAWRFNVCRAHYFKNGKELSAWSALRDAHFQFTDDFGKIVFEKNQPLVREVRVNAEGVTAELANPSGQPVTLDISMVRHSGNDAFRTASAPFAIPAKSTRSFVLKDPVKEPGLRFAEIRNGGKLIYKHNNMPSEEYYAFAVFDPEGVRTQTHFLAVDTPFFIAMGFRHNARGRTTHNLIERNEQKFDLYMEVPEGIDLRGMIFDAGTWRQTPFITPSVKPVIRDGVRMNEFKFELPLIIHWPENAFLFFYKCSLPEGKALNGSCWLVKNGQALEKQPMAFRTMKVGKIRREPKLFTNDAFYITPKILYYTFPEDTIRQYKALGMNRITFWTTPGKNKDFYAGNTPKTVEDYDDLFFTEMKKPGYGLFFTSNSSSATPQAWSWTHNDKNAHAMGADGKDAPFNQYGYPSLCPSYRGPEFQKHVVMLTDSYLFRKYGCTWLTLDLELWPKTAWDKLCFCDRCLAEFRQFAPQYANADVRTEFLSGKDPEFKKTWEAFKDHQHARFIRDLTDPVRKIAGGKPSSGTKDRFMLGEWCRPKKHLIGLIDYFEVGFYFTPDVVYKNFVQEYEKWGDRQKFLYPTFTFGQSGGCPDFHMREDQVTELLYEAAVFGSQGVCWYHYQYLEPRRLKAMIDGLNAIIPYEDLIVNGFITDTASADNPAMQVTRRENGPEGLLAVRAYGASSDQTGTVTLRKLSGPVSVFDCAGGGKVAQVSPENPSFKIKVNKNRCRLLYLGTDEKFAVRNK